MKSLLISHNFRKVGFVLLPFAIALLIAVFINDYSIPFLKYQAPIMALKPVDIRNYDLSDEVAILISFVSLFMIAFSKEKQEDEYLLKVRLRALQISVYINYLVLAVSVLAVYGLGFLYVLYGNLFTILIIFIAVYYYEVHFKARMGKEGQYEK